MMITLARVVIILALFSSATTAPAAGGSNRVVPDRRVYDEVRSLTIEGLEYLFNFQINEAARKFSQAKAIDPTHPRPYVSRALAPTWTYFATKSPSDYDDAVNRASQAIDVGIQFVDVLRPLARTPEMRNHYADALTCLGTAYGLRGFMHAQRKSYMRAVWDAKKSYDFFREAISVDSTFYDPYLGLGLYHFALGTIPRPLQWVASLLGIDGDRERGMQEIEKAARNGTYNATEARYYLVQFYPWFRGDFESSEQIVNGLIERYPQNTVFLYSKGFLALRKNNVAAALPSFKRIQELDNQHFPSFTRFAELRLGDCYFRLGEYELAREAFLSYLTLKNQNLFEAMASYHVGLTYELTGQRANAVQYYRRAQRSEVFHGDDVFAARQSAKLLRIPLSAADSLYIVARNAHRSNRCEAAETHFKQLLAHTNLTGDERALGAHGLAECLYDRGKYESASHYFRTALEEKVEGEMWTQPWSHYWLAQIALKEGNIGAARQSLRKALEYGEYDHKNWLAFRAQRDLEDLRQRTR